MKLTKEQIEIIRWVVNVDDVHFSERAVAELCRLAMLGLERDERQAVTSEQAAKDIKILEQIHAKSWDEAVALRHAAEALSERDERAERIGRAVLVAGDTARFALDVAIDHIRNGIGFEDDEIPKLRAIADAMEDSP